MVNTSRSEASLGETPNSFGKFLDNVCFAQQVVGICTSDNKSLFGGAWVCGFPKSAATQKDQANQPKSAQNSRNNMFATRTLRPRILCAARLTMGVCEKPGKGPEPCPQTNQKGNGSPTPSFIGLRPLGHDSLDLSKLLSESLVQQVVEGGPLFCHLCLDLLQLMLNLIVLGQISLVMLLDIVLQSLHAQFEVVDPLILHCHCCVTICSGLVTQELLVKALFQCFQVHLGGRRSSIGFGCFWRCCPRVIVGPWIFVRIAHSGFGGEGR